VCFVFVEYLKTARDYAMRGEVIIYAGDDGYWVAECPRLPGCISQSKTKANAITNTKRQSSDTLQC
jgi:hypothetical protein